jgi:hypothetical protein
LWGAFNWPRSKSILQELLASNIATVDVEMAVSIR